MNCCMQQGFFKGKGQHRGVVVLEFELQYLKWFNK